MTSTKSISWSALVNIGNNESIALTVSGEAANPDEARDIFAFAIGQLIGVANSADEATASLIRAYVSRLVQTEEARPVAQDAPAPVKEPAKVAPPVAAPAPVMGPAPTVAEQAAAAVAQCIKPPATAPKEPAPSAPPTPEASAPAAAAAPPEGFSLCAECGEAVPANQAKLSQLFQGKTLCKSCMDVK
jgi:hypothetical protein